MIALVPRFPDMFNPYDRKLIDLTKAIAMDEKITLHEGVYVAVSGPNLETRAEYRFLRLAGADVVECPPYGSDRCGPLRLKALGLSVITDMCLPMHWNLLTQPKIKRSPTQPSPSCVRWVKGVLSKM